MRTDRACRATLRYGLRDAARLLGVAPERLAQRTRARASIDADECRDLLRSITADGQIVEPLGTDLSPLAEPVALDDTEPREEQTGGARMGMTLEEIVELARDYARAVDRLAEVSEEIRDQQRHAVRQRLRGLKARAAEASAARAVLHDAIDASRERFAASPRTRAIDGVKYGLRKQPGRVEVTDEARSIARIRERLPDWADTLIRTTERLQRAALRKLDSRRLAAIGVRVEAVDDEVVISAAASDLDKLVEALLADGEDAA